MSSRSDAEYNAMLDNLTATQKRCSELLEEVRRLKQLDNYTAEVKNLKEKLLRTQEELSVANAKTSIYQGGTAQYWFDLYSAAQEKVLAVRRIV